MINLTADVLLGVCGFLLVLPIIYEVIRILKHSSQSVPHSWPLLIGFTLILSCMGSIYVSIFYWSAAFSTFFSALIWACLGLIKFLRRSEHQEVEQQPVGRIYTNNVEKEEEQHGNYLRLNTAPSQWRTRNIDEKLFAILEVLYFYTHTKIMSPEEEAEYSDIFCDVMSCKDISELDIADYLEPAIETFIEFLKSLTKSGTKEADTNEPKTEFEKA